MTEINAAETFLFDRLRGRTQLTDLLAAGPDSYGKGVYRSTAPLGAGLPLVVFDVFPISDIHAQEGHVIEALFEAIIKGISEGRSASQADQIAQEIHNAVQIQVGTVGTPAEWEVSAYRLRPLDLPVDDVGNEGGKGKATGRTFQQRGGVYRVRVRKVV